MSEVSLKDGNARIDDPVRPGTYIAVTFWGEEYRRFFLDYCLASLMAPGNIPAIRNKDAARLLIATRQDDWQAIQSEPIFMAAKRHIAIEHVPHEAALDVPNNKKMSVMSNGHKLLTKRMFEDRAQCVMVYPDAIIADGAIRKIEELAESGYKVVLCMAVRFANEGLQDELNALVVIGNGRPLVIEPKDLVRLSIKHMHSEAVRLEFEAELDDQAACSFFWTVAAGQNLLFHCANWAPMLIDYGSMVKHDASTFDEWTFDGDYVAKNFPDARDIYVVRDTTELFLTSFTSETKVSFRKIRLLPYRLPALRETIKIIRAHEYMTAYNVLDDVKRIFFRVPIRVQGGVSSEVAWQDAEARAAKIVDRIIDPGAVLAMGCYGWSIIRKSISRGLRVWRGFRGRA